MINVKKRFKIVCRRLSRRFVALKRSYDAEFWRFSWRASYLKGKQCPQWKHFIKDKNDALLLKTIYLHLQFFAGHACSYLDENISATIGKNSAKLTAMYY